LCFNRLFGPLTGRKKIAGLAVIIVRIMAAALPLPAQTGEQAEDRAAVQEAPEQETADMPDQGPAEPDPDESGPPIYVIRSVEFERSGNPFSPWKSRPFVLFYHGEFKYGEEIRGIAGLEEYVRDKAQLLMNQRVLEDVRIGFTVGDMEPDGRYPVSLRVFTKDTWNIIAIPRPQYSSNSGFDLTVKARDYNFLGIMEPLRLDIGYNHDEHGEDIFKMEIDSNIPFTALGYYWRINFDHVFNWTAGNNPSYKNVTGIAMELPFRRTTFTFGFDESFIWHESNEGKYHEYEIDNDPGDPDNDPFGKRYFDGLYASSELYTSWKVPTGIDIPGSGELTYLPQIGLQINYSPSAWPLDDVRIGPFLNMGQRLGFDRVDWIGNYRRGFDVSFSNENQFDVHRRLFNNSLKLEAIGHFILTDFLGFSGRFQYRHWFYHYPYNFYEGAGDALRGIIDKDIPAKFMFSLNFDLPLRLFRFTPSQWTGRSKLRFFDFECQLAPVLDMAFYQGADNALGFTASGGGELVIFPNFMRSLHLRISVGYDLNDMAKAGGFTEGGTRMLEYLIKNTNEIFIGVDFHY
jgi:hypothetical protein